MPNSETAGFTSLSKDQVRKAIALRAVRNALAIPQVDLAKAVRSSKSPLASFETLAAPLNEAVYTKIVDFFGCQGATIKTNEDGVTVTLDNNAIDSAKTRLGNRRRRRRDSTARIR